MSHARNSSADKAAAAHAVGSLLAHHRLKVATPVRKAMEALHLSATRAERRRKNTKTDAERIRDYLARRVLTGRSLPTAAETAGATKIGLKNVHAHIAMMRKRAKKK